jgi:hypothetical protein
MHTPIPTHRGSIKARLIRCPLLNGVIKLLDKSLLCFEPLFPLELKRVLVLRQSLAAFINKPRYRQCHYYWLSTRNNFSSRYGLVPNHDVFSPTEYLFVDDASERVFRRTRDEPARLLGNHNTSLKGI